MKAQEATPQNPDTAGLASAVPPPLPPELTENLGTSFGECPYGKDRPAVYHQGAFRRMDEATMGAFLANGFRRNGNYLYTMQCPGCAECVSIRLNPETLRLNRNQRRVLRKNGDVRVELAPLAMSPRHLALLNTFLRTRFQSVESQAESYYTQFFLTTLGSCFEMRYWVDTGAGTGAGKTLVGVAIVDASPNWLNAVYFYFDPDESWRSPGTFNILNLVRFAKEHGIPRVYLGYRIAGLSAMSYKSAFLPHELLLNGRWCLVEG